LLWFIITTWACNLNCRYCGNEPNPYGEPTNPSYDIDALRRFLRQDPSPIICFYGGEPLLRFDNIASIIENIKAYKFVLQTNGLLLRKIDPSYLARIDTILVSIDGRKVITDYYRGRGVYDTVINNSHYLRTIGYNGDLIARMTVSGRSGIYRDVKHLLDLNIFDHIHWQLDVFFDAPPSRYDDFDAWLKNYKLGLRKLLELWLENLKNGRILGLVPFQGILKIMIKGERRKLPCGAGIDAFSISTSGRIYACPISPSPEFYLGDIWSSKISYIVGKITIGEPCISCDYYDVCGGRCLYANKTMLWGEKMFTKICDVTKYLIEMLKESVPLIDNLVTNGIVSWEDILYPEYNNTTEIIP